MANILWLDDDRVSLIPFKVALEKAGHVVCCATTPYEAEQMLSNPTIVLTPGVSWNMIIIDVMMCIGDSFPNSRYTLENTENGTKAGFVFFQVNKNRLRMSNVKVVVLTMRTDRKLFAEFASAGLPADRIKDKMEVADTARFVRWINDVLETPHGNT